MKTAFIIAALAPAAFALTFYPEANCQGTGFSLGQDFGRDQCYQIPHGGALSCVCVAMTADPHSVKADVPDGTEDVFYAALDECYNGETPTTRVSSGDACVNAPSASEPFKAIAKNNKTALFRKLN